MQKDVLANLAYAEGTEGTPGGGVVTGARLEPAWWVQKNMEAVSNDDIDIEHHKGQYGTIYGRQKQRRQCELQKGLLPILGVTTL